MLSFPIPIRAGIASVVAISLALVARASAAQAALTDDQLRATSLRIAELDVRRQLRGATLATIDSLLAFYSDSVVYEHPSVSAIVRGKTAVRAGMERFLGSRPAAYQTVPRVTIGAGVVVLEFPAGPDPRDPAKTIPATRRAVRMLEFDSRGLVRRILDYPW